jgi:hypothetical protein
MAEITAANIQKAKDAVALYHTAHAVLSAEQAASPDHILPGFQERHTKLIEDFKMVLIANNFTSIDHFFQVAYPGV